MTKVLKLGTFHRLVRGFWKRNVRLNQPLLHDAAAFPASCSGISGDCPDFIGIPRWLIWRCEDLLQCFFLDFNPVVGTVAGTSGHGCQRHGWSNILVMA
ncbi:hypothetical protein SESBI_17967 [Sesbania bispinosa]|nr:hypothetical protein SESBI_17967 [Sesbania bispinosa]